MARKIAIILAEGFEEIEALAPADVLRRLGFEVILVGLVSDKVKGSHGITVSADCLLSSVKITEADLLMLPGGMPGSVNLRNSNELIGLLKDASNAGKFIAAICAAPIALGRAGLIKGKKVTAYPGFEDKLEGATYTGGRIERDGNIITAKGAGVSFEFAAEIAAALGKSKETEELYRGMFVK